MAQSKPTLCVCVSGQMRFYEAASRQLAQAIDDFEPVYVIETWTKRGGKVEGAWNADQLHRVLTDDLARLVPRALIVDNRFVGIPALHDFLHSRAVAKPDVTSEEVAEHYAPAVIHVEDEAIVDAYVREQEIEEKNSLRMLYKWARCHRGVADYETANQMRFDYFLRLRPDLWIESSLGGLRERVKPGSILVDWVDESGCVVGDSFAFGCREDLPLYCGLADTVGAWIAGSVKVEQWGGIHNQLFTSLKDRGLAMGNAGMPMPIVKELIDGPTFQALVEESLPRADEPYRPALLGLKSVLLAHRALLAGSLAEAREHGLAAIRSSPKASGGYHLLARIEEREDNHPAAYRAATQALALAMDSYHDDHLRETARAQLGRQPDLTSARAAIENARAAHGGSGSLDAHEEAAVAFFTGRQGG